MIPNTVYMLCKKQCKHCVNSCQCTANSSFTFWNFLEFFPQIFLIYCWLNLWVWNPWIWRAHSTVLNGSGENGYISLVPDFRGKVFSLSPLSIMLAVGLSYMTFIMLRYVPSIPISHLLILHMLNHSGIPGINPAWSWCIILLICCWIHFANILLRILKSIVVGDIGLYILGSLLVWFWYQGNAGLVKWIQKCSLLFDFLEELRRLILILF